MCPEGYHEPLYVLVRQKMTFSVFYNYYFPSFVAPCSPRLFSSTLYLFARTFKLIQNTGSQMGKVRGILSQ